MTSLASDVLIVGGGAAGLSAALAASYIRRVTIVDDNPLLGGQIWRAELGAIRSPDAKRLVDQLDSRHISVINSAKVFAASGDCALRADTPDGLLELKFSKLILAAGARERFLPFPGWTLPNVYGAGGLQAMVKGGLPVSGKRIVIAGTGPLLLAVADYLRSKGGVIVAIAEQAPLSKLMRFGVGLWRSPSKLIQAAGLRARLRGIPYITDCWVTRAESSSSGNLNRIRLSRKGHEQPIDCDLLACGYHLVPNTELARLLGCSIDDGFVEVDEHQQTSVENIFCAGEPTGIGGIESSIIEGRIAGFAASGQREKARELFNRRDKTRAFGQKLNTAFELRSELKQLAEPDTIVCRCEDVEYGRLTEYANFRDAKLQTRCGMGPCQSRVCGPAAEFLFGWQPGTVRPPIFPVRMEHL